MMRALIDRAQRIPPVYLVAGGLVALALVWAASKGAKGTGQAIGGGVVDLVGGVLGGAVDALPDGINPTSSGNVVNGAVSIVGGAATGQDARDFSLGAWLFEKLNPGAVARENQAMGK